MPISEDFIIEPAADRVALVSAIGPLEFDISGKLHGWDAAAGVLDFQFVEVVIRLAGKKARARARTEAKCYLFRARRRSPPIPPLPIASAPQLPPSVPAALLRLAQDQAQDLHLLPLARRPGGGAQQRGRPRAAHPQVSMGTGGSGLGLQLLSACLLIFPNVDGEGTQECSFDRVMGV